MQSIDAERELVREVELKTNQRKKYLIATVVLTFLSAGLLAGLIVLSVVHVRHLQSCSTSNTSSSGSSSAAGSVGPIGPVVPEVPPFMAPAPSKRRLVIATAPNGLGAPRPTGTITHQNSTSPLSKSGNGTCEAGPVYGGQQLDDLNHDVYMPLMQKALSLSPAAVQNGEVRRNYYQASLRSIFRCVDGESMGAGSLELVDACRGGYVVSGDEIECDGDGSYGGNSEAEASPSSGSGLAGI